jgi:hypothetical protein
MVQQEKPRPHTTKEDVTARIQLRPLPMGPSKCITGSQGQHATEAHVSLRVPGRWHVAECGDHQAGYGFAYTRFPFARMEEFRRLEREAREQRRGLWTSK